MITFKYHHKRAAALAYLEKRLSGKDDGDGIPCAVSWFGCGTERLGLRGDVTMENVRALLAHRHPLEGNPLIEPWEVKEAKRSPWLTEFIIASPHLTCRKIDDDATFAKYRDAADCTAYWFETFAAGRLRDYGACIITGNLVGMTFGRCHFCQGRWRLFKHFVLFNLTFDESEELWRGLDTSEMELTTPSAVDHYEKELDGHCFIRAMREKAQQRKTGEHSAALARSELN